MNERRPVPGRRWKISEFFVDILIKLNITPNTASFIGMLFGILSGFSFYLTAKNPKFFWLFGAFLIFLRSAFNIFDGMIAERTGKSSPWGGFVNDFTDRIADVFMTIGFGFAQNSSPFLGFLATVGALLTANVRVTGKAYSSKMTYAGIMSKPIRMYLIILCSVIMAFYPFEKLPVYTLYLIIFGTIITMFHRIWLIKGELE